MLTLVEEGDLRPTGPRIAERAGVSVRSVFHHFADLDALLTTVADRQTRRLLTLARPLSAEGPLPARIAAFSAQRAAMSEAITPVRRAATLAEPFSPHVTERLRQARRLARAQTEGVFAPELNARSAEGREQLLTALAAVSSWSFWEELRARQHLSVGEAQALIERILRALLGAKEVRRSRD